MVPGELDYQVLAAEPGELPSPDLGVIEIPRHATAGGKSKDRKTGRDGAPQGADAGVTLSDVVEQGRTGEIGASR